jgi:hypothetical protein
MIYNRPFCSSLFSHFSRVVLRSELGKDKDLLMTFIKPFATDDRKNRYFLFESDDEMKPTEKLAPFRFFQPNTKIADKEADSSGFNFLKECCKEETQSFLDEGILTIRNKYEPCLVGLTNMVLFSLDHQPELVSYLIFLYIFFSA